MTEETPLTISEMGDMVAAMYETGRGAYPTDVERDYDNAVMSARITLRTDYGIDLNDPKVKEICVRFYSALCIMSASATDDGLDDWFGVVMFGAALGVPED